MKHLKIVIMLIVSAFFLDMTENPNVFKNVSSASLNTNDSIGGFGKSDHAMMIDYWNWKYDFNTEINNYASMRYGEFDLSKMLSPKLEIDVSCAGKSTLGPGNLTLEVRTRTKVKQYAINPSSFITQSSGNIRYIPNKNSLWKKLNIDLIDFIGEKNITLTFIARATTSTAALNSMYLDNFIVKEGINYCLEGGINLYKQSQIDSFQITRGDCNSIKGNVCVGACGLDNYYSDITSLEGLTNIKYIEGNLNLTSLPSLEKMPSLANLLTVGGDLTIEKCPKLQNVLGFNNLKRIGGTFRISENATLFSIAGITNLIVIGGDFNIHHSLQLGFNTTTLSVLDSVKGSILLSHLTRPFDFSNFKKLKYIGNSFVIDSCTNLINVNQLPLIDTLKGNLVFKDLKLGSLNYFPNLKCVKGDLNVVNCQKLTSLNAFQKLTTIFGNLILKNCNSIFDLSGFKSVNSIHGGLDLIKLDALKSIEPFKVVSFIGKNISIKENKELISLDGLDKLSSVYGDFSIEGNDNLLSLAGLENISNIFGTLKISNNPSLKNLQQFKKLTIVTGAIELENNLILNNIVDLENVDSDSLHKYGPLGEPKMKISRNSILEKCNNKLVCALIANNESMLISNNLGACENLDDVEAACTSLTFGSGKFQYSIYPNPVHHLLNVKTDRIVYFSLLNLDGKMIQSGTFDSNTVNYIDFNLIQSGIYVLHLGGVKSVKVVKI